MYTHISRGSENDISENGVLALTNSASPRCPVRLRRRVLFSSVTDAKVPLPTVATSTSGRSWSETVLFLLGWIVDNRMRPLRPPLI
jgi:hypothetical protein